MRQYLFNTEKIKYVLGKKPAVECILCAMRDRHGDVTGLEIIRSEFCLVTINLYPYNPGHLMIFPLEHLRSPVEFSTELALDMHRFLTRSLSILQEAFNPSGFNVGYNLGSGSGASIEHAHLHIVPRYENEAGFLDVLAGTRVVVSDPVSVMEILKERFNQS